MLTNLVVFCVQNPDSVSLLTVRHSCLAKFVKHLKNIVI